MRFLPNVEHDVANVGLYQVERHADRFRKFRNGRKVLIVDPEVQHYAAKVKRRTAEALIQLQAVKQEQAVLSAGDADADLVAGADHVVAFIRTADAP